MSSPGEEMESVLPEFAKLTPRRRAFLLAFIETCSIQRAAEANQTNRTTHYLWMRQDADYRACFELAKDIAIQGLEDEAVRRAKEGVDEVLFHQGKAIKVKRYSDRLMEVLLKRFRPAQYSERHAFESSGTTAVFMIPALPPECRSLALPSPLPQHRLLGERNGAEHPRSCEEGEE